MLDTVAVENYRSMRRLVVPLGRCNVVTGPNGSGKSSLYRALRLLADSARNGAVNALAREGGLSSTMWAGPGRTGPVSLKLGYAGDGFGYAVDLGLPREFGARLLAVTSHPGVIAVTDLPFTPTGSFPDQAEGILGNGAGRVDLRTSGADIFVHR